METIIVECILRQAIFKQRYFVKILSMLYASAGTLAMLSYILYKLIRANLVTPYLGNISKKCFVYITILDSTRGNWKNSKLCENSPPCGRRMFPHNFSFSQFPLVLIYNCISTRKMFYINFF